MRRAPKKFTDATQSEITPEWKDWYAIEAEDMADDMRDHIAFLEGQPGLQNRWPEEYDKEIGNGAWILVVEEPYTEVKQLFTVPTPSLWWARPAGGRPYSIPYGPKSRPVMIPGVYKVVIETPGGSLWLFPHEYVVCKDPVPLITDPECTIHPLGGEATLDEELEEQMFYLQSRGITRQDALLMLMDGVDFSHWGWVEFPEYARAAYEGVGRTIPYTPMAGVFKRESA